MAPRRSPDGFLAKATSARALPLALVVAALLGLAGCGGGEKDSSTTATGTTTTTSPSAEDTRQAGGAKQDKAGAKGGSSGNDSKSEQGGSEVPQPEGEREPGITPQQRRKATTASIALESPAFQGGTPIPARFTCEGKNVSPPLRWRGLPEGAGELVVMALNLLPVEGALFFDWAVAGLDPSLDGLEEGTLPSGAILGANSFGKRGYGLCPPTIGKEERYLFMVYAIPEALEPKSGFDPLKLREEVLAQAGDVGIFATSFTR